MQTVDLGHGPVMPSFRDGSSHPRRPVAVAAALALLLNACAVQRRLPETETAPGGVVETFLGRVVAGDHEGAFALLDIDILVNYGHPQGKYYRSLAAGDQQRYRKDFVEGIYAFLFRDAPPARAVWRVDIPAAGGSVADVTGRPGKRLRLTLGQTPAGTRIVAIEKP